MACFCFGRASFESALRKGDVEAALAHLESDPLITARRHFGSGNTLWHIATTSGHLPLLQALAQRLTAVWPTPEPDPHAHLQQHPAGHHLHINGHHGHGHFARRSNPFQRISDGLRGIGPDTTHLPLAAFINTPNLLGQTPLMTACNQGHPGCVKFLLDLGANAWYRDRANCTALHYATLHDQGECIEAILQHPASARPPPGTRQSLVRLVDLPNFTGYTALHFAAAANKPRALAALLAGGANIGARCWSEGSDWISGPTGSTPLHLAARRGDVELCRLMMRHYLEVLRDSGAPDPRLHTDVRGLRPYQRAQERHCRELAEMLLPSTPLLYIFGADVVRLYKVPKLKALASAALQEALLAQINEVEAVASERRKLATQVAVAAARAAAAAGGAGGGFSAAAAGDAAGDGGSAVASPTASRTRTNSLTRTASRVSEALNFVRQRSLRPLNSLRRRLRASGRWVTGDSAARDAAPANPPYSPLPMGALGTSSVHRYSGYGGTAGTRTISGVSVVNGCVPGSTPRPSGVPPPLASQSTISAVSAGITPWPSANPPHPGALGRISPAAAAAAPPVQHGLNGQSAAAAVMTGVAPLLAGAQRSAPLTGGVAAASPAGPTGGSAAAAATAAGPRPWRTGSIGSGVPGGASPTGTPPGGCSPVRGSSFDSDWPVVLSARSPLYPGLGGGGGALELPPTALGCAAAAGVPAGMYDGVDPSVGIWAGRTLTTAAAAAAGVPSGGSPPPGGGGGDAPSHGYPGRALYIPPVRPPLPPPPLRHDLASPFALQAMQAQALGRNSGTPADGSPTTGYGALYGGGSLPPPAPQPPLLQQGQPPAAAKPRGNLRPVSETNVEAAVASVAAAATVRTGERVSQRASKYIVLSTTSAALDAATRPPSGPDGVDGLPAGGSPTPGSPSQGGPRMTGCGLAAAASAVVGRLSGEYLTGRLTSASNDPAGGSPPLGAFQLPGAPSFVLGGHAVGGAGSRTASARPQASGGSGTLGQGAVGTAEPGGAAGGGGGGGATIGSDTSEDYCGVCFERPAVLHIRPCQHTLCAECSREVTRMVETQPPSCPFCRGIVHGFGL